MPAFFVSSLDIRETQITLTGDLCHHVRASLRVKPGEDLWLTDEQRRRYRVRVTHVSQQAVMTEILEQRLGPVETGPPPAARTSPAQRRPYGLGGAKGERVGRANDPSPRLTAWGRTTAAGQDRRPSGPLAAHRHRSGATIGAVAAPGSVGTAGVTPLLLHSQSDLLASPGRTP